MTRLLQIRITSITSEGIILEKIAEKFSQK